MLKHKKAILFDLDGTLVDSMWVWTKIDDRFAEKYHFTLPDTMHHDIEGMSFYETACYFKKRFRLLQSVEEIMEEWNEMAYQTYAAEVSLKPGAAALLSYAQKQGIKTAICTSNSRMLMNALIKSDPLFLGFDSILTSDEINVGKPAPDIYLKTAEKLCVAPEDCLVFEDIPQGILAGLRAGMEVCGVADDFSSGLEPEKRRLAHYYIAHFDQVLDGTYETLEKIRSDSP